MFFQAEHGHLRRVLRIPLALIAVGLSMGQDVEEGLRPPSVPDPWLMAANEALDLTRSTVVSPGIAGELGGALDVTLTLEGADRRLVLWPDSVRSERFRVMAQLDDGSFTDVPAGPVRTLSGAIDKVPGSRVVGAWLEGGLYLRVFLGESEYGLQPAPEGSGAGAHLLYAATDVVPPVASCGTEDGTVDVDEPPGDYTGFGLRIAELACDADFEYFQDLGSVAAVRDRIELIIHSMNEQYRRDVGIEHKISAILVRSSPQQPYTFWNPRDLLRQFQAEWLFNLPFIRRDVAQLFTGKPFGSTIGIAYIASVCDLERGYGIVWNYSDNLVCATDLSAHELGHNWGAQHCLCPDYTMNPSIMCRNRFDPVWTAPGIRAFRDARTCLEVLDGGPDLVVSDLSFPAIVGHGGRYLVTGRVRNVGDHTTAATIQLGSWLTLDGDPFHGGDDIPLGGSCLNIDLDPGEDVDFGFWSLPIPFSAAAGQQQFVLCADTLGGPCGGAPPCSVVCGRVVGAAVARGTL
ncbi:MAG: hypothetical protein GY711_35290 [bacterium]|nr:hypothetical protein [bacterium]